MLQPMKNQRSKPAPQPKPFGDRKKSRRDHENSRHDWQGYDHESQ